MRVCAITNVYNESYNLPIWIKRYSKQVGIENLIVVDHGSDDGSTSNLDRRIGVIRLPRTPFDDRKRSAAISNIANGLLQFWDVVIYSDADELLVADPRKYSNLVDYFSKRDDVKHVTAIGLNLIHNIGAEDTLDLEHPITRQRSYAQFVSPMCKTLATREPITWGGGFHSSTLPPKFDDVYLFHLRSVDLPAAFSRLGLTRKMAWAGNEFGAHQRRQNIELLSQFEAYCKWQVKEGDFDFKAETDEVLAKTVEHGGRFHVPLNVIATHFRLLPEWVRDVF